MASWYTPFGPSTDQGDYARPNQFMGTFNYNGNPYYLPTGFDPNSSSFQAARHGDGGWYDANFDMVNGAPQLTWQNYNKGGTFMDDVMATAPVWGAALGAYGLDKAGLLGGGAASSAGGAAGATGAAGAAGGATPALGSLGSGMFGVGGAPNLAAGLGTGMAGTGMAGAAGAVGGAGVAAAPAAAAGALGGLGDVLGGVGSWMSGNSNWLMPLLGAAAGAAGSGDTQQTTEQRLPPWLDAISQGQAGVAQNLLNMPYPGQEPFNADQQNAFQRVRNAANSPLSGQADAAMSNYLSPSYLSGSNPYLESMVSQNMDQMQARLNNSLFGSGSFGSANVAKQGIDAMSDAANRLRYDDFNTRTNNQFRAVGAMPTLDQSRYAGANNLLNIGGMQQQFGQQERFGPFNWYQNLLQASGIPLTQYRGGTTTQTQQGDPWSGGLGGGLLGLQLAQLLGGGNRSRYPGDLGVA